MGRKALIAQLGGTIAWATAVVAVLPLGTEASKAADVRVFTSGAPSAVQKAVAAKFMQATGHRVIITAETLGKIRQELAGAEYPDVVVLPVPTINALDKAGELRPGTRIDLARVGIGVAVREGAPLPDISTVDAVRKTLLAARSIGHPDPKGGGFTGAQIARMIERMGIADAVKPKVVLMYAFTGGVENIAKGDVDIGLFNVSEIVPVKGVTLVGPLPRDLQSYITFAGAVHARSVQPDAAAAFLRTLSDPSAHDAWTAGGFEALGRDH
jgi:molybdate transport system substrate-binding protein